MFKNRIEKVKQLLNKGKIDALLVSSVSNISYLTGYANFSKDEREAYLLIGNDFQYIITDGRYSEAIKREVPRFELFERSHKNKTEDLLKSLKSKISILAIEEDDLTVSEYKLIKKHFKIKHLEVSRLRSIKNPLEIEKIEKACKIGDLAFEYILKQIKAGVTEKNISDKLESFIKSKGAQFSFPAIVAFGANSAVPHHQTGGKRLTVNDKLILIDFGVKFEDYCSDMTRTVFFGSPSRKQKDIYEAVLIAKQKAVDFINSSIASGKEIKSTQADKVSRDYIISRGYPSIPHSLGHGIGLDVHEHPHLSLNSKEVLKEGMVFSIEPGIYIPDFGGVRIEDLFVFESGGLRQITNAPVSLLFSV